MLRVAWCAVKAKKNGLPKVTYPVSQTPQRAPHNTKRITRNANRLARKANPKHSDLKELYILNKLAALES